MSAVSHSQAIEYPDSDGLPMADNTLQFQWIVTIQGSLDWIFREQPDVFVAGDLLWYPVEGNNKLRAAPDAMVVFGRPKGYRGSYMQWREDDIPPQVVFEVLSPGNRPREITRKFQFYDVHQVEEYYVIDPDHNFIDGWIRQAGMLREIDNLDGWVSPKLGIQFQIGEGQPVRILQPDGTPFLTYQEARALTDDARQLVEQESARAEQESARAEQESARAEQESARAEQESARAAIAAAHAEQESARAERLAARLRELGVEPNDI